MAMTNMAWRDVVPLLHHPRCQGAGPFHLMAAEPFYDEAMLPFDLADGGAALHIRPLPGFTKEHFAATLDERLLVADCPDDTGWIVPEELVANWLNRHVECAELEDLMLAHRLYEYLTTPDEKGRSRGGARGELIQWVPGVPTLAVLYPPEFLPGDPDAPAVNRDRTVYAAAVADLLEQLEEAFGLVEIEVGLRFGDDPIPWEAEDLQEEAVQRSDRER